MSDTATFSLFVRDLPPDRGFLVAAGLESCLRVLEEFALDDEDLVWLSGHGFADTAVAAFATLGFTGDVWAIPEGHVILPNEPLIEVTAPLAEAQLVESILLNQITFQTALATKAARCSLAARGRASLVDFSLRRTHGIEASMAAARAAAIAGFAGTSNVEAATDGHASCRHHGALVRRGLPDRT
jgi:nicotinate phosphoribosyltransferase